MRSGLYGIAIGMLLFGAAGCTMCDTCDLDTFTSYGGRWQRTNPTHGRVGSIFAPAGAQVPYGEETLFMSEEPEAEAIPPEDPVEQSVLDEAPAPPDEEPE